MLHSYDVVTEPEHRQIPLTELPDGVVVAILGGHTASGKDRCLNTLRSRNRARKGVTTTDRLGRPGEEDGRDYDFVSRERYKELDGAGAFVETSPYKGKSRYGSTWARFREGVESTPTTVWILDVNGLLEYQKHFPGRVVSVYLWSSRDVAEERLRNRPGTTEQDVTDRLTGLEEEREMGKATFDFNLCTNELTPEQVADEVIRLLRI